MVSERARLSETYLLPPYYPNIMPIKNINTLNLQDQQDKKNRGGYLKCCEEH
jgi:hypothetical protein